MANFSSIKDIGMIITNLLPKNKYNMKVEVSQPRITNGHMYLKLKDKDGIIDSKIWKTSVTEIIKNIKNGDMVEVQGKLGYYIPTGSLSMIISDLKPCIDIGDMHSMYETMKNDYMERGYFDNKKKLPNIISNILILSSKNGAAIQDFYYVLDSNNSKVKRTLIDVIVQGNECPIQISKVLNNTNLDVYDLIVITRGGGSMEDLWCFNHKDIVESVHNCSKPILSAIGHMIDTTLIDLVADISTPTPSLAAQYIINHNNKYSDNNINKLAQMRMKLINYINTNINKLDNINMKVTQSKYDIKIKLNNIKVRIDNQLIGFIQNKITELNNMIIQPRLYLTNKKNVEINNTMFQKILNKKQSFNIIWNNIKVVVTDYNI